MDKKQFLTISLLCIAVLLLAFLFIANLTGGSIFRLATNKISPSCMWLDRYGSVDIQFKPANSVCPRGYNSTAYELRRDFFFYSQANCSDNSLVSATSDHQLVQPGNTVPNIGVEAGNLNKCAHLKGSSYAETFQEYDGVLCCS